MAIGRIPEPGTGIPESIIAAKGDLLTGTANDTPAVLTVGANGTTLVADSAETTGLKWATPASGSTYVGCVLSKGSNQTITAGSYQAITFTTEDIDTDGFHSNATNTSRITVPTGKGGKYLITANFTYGNFNTPTQTYLCFFACSGLTDAKAIKFSQLIIKI
jgi:hypothetical protein